MPLYDFYCSGCREDVEKSAPIADRHTQVCEKCETPLTLIWKPTPKYIPFHNYFDLGLGVEVTGRDHRRRVMRDLCCDHRDPPRKGDVSVRKDQIRERMRAGN